MKAFTESGAFWIAVIMLLVVLFMLPTLIGLVRRVDNLPLIFLVNLIGAPTLMGWPVALLLAFGPRRHSLKLPAALRHSDVQPSTACPPGELDRR